MSKRSLAQTSKLWLTSTKILTSHLPTVESHKPASPGKSKSQNGNNKFNPHHKNREGGHRKEKSKHSQHSDKFFFQKDSRRQSFHKPKPEDRVDHDRSNNQKAVPQVRYDSHQGDLVSNINPFELFCAYHLGIEPGNTYKPANINQVGQRFGVDPATIRQATKKYKFDPESMMDRDFDLALAQLDIQVAPEGVSKTELAKGIYEEFLNAPILKRDWKKILEDDRKENVKTFGS